MPAVVSDVVADVTSVSEKLRADDRLITSADMLLGDAEALLDVITTARAVLVRRLRAAAAMDATEEVAGRATKAWLTEDLLLAKGEASQLWRLVRDLPEFPATEAAFDAADIGTAHAAAICTALQTLPIDIRPTVEPHLIERARFYPPEEISGFVDELLERLGLDKTSDTRREQRNASRGVDLARTLHGTRSIAGTLSPEVGEQLEKALELAGVPGGLEDHRTFRQRQHDALGAIAIAYLANHGAPPSFTGAPRTVIITMDLELLENRLRDAWLALPSGAVISADTARRMACDAAIVPVVLGGNSEVLDIGVANHEFTVAIRRAAYLRDGGKCAFPGCCKPVSELHHIVFRRRGGATSLENAAWLCSFHHWLVHEGRWTLQRDPNGDYLWTSPHGRQRTRHLKPDRQP